jgi:hypothetical protein
LSGGGTIRANAGNGGTSGGGGGGGGRIAIYATNVSSFGGQLSANYGSGNYGFSDLGRRSALPGTIYLSDWGLLPTALTNGGMGRFTAGTGIAASVTVSNYTMFLEWSWETNRLKAGTVLVQNNGKIKHIWNTAASTNGAGEWVPDAGIFIECSNLNVAVGGEINGDGFGYSGGPNSGNGYGYGRGTCSGSSGGGGAGYGGWGGMGAVGAGGTTYGIVTNPALPGSGGAGGSSSFGGGGGGYLRLLASGTVTVDGTISMNGTDANYNYGGGGSGGGVYIQCGSLGGGGTIRANAGNGGTSGGGGGGGGRIAIYATNINSFGGQISANIGSGSYAFPDIYRRSPVPGTVYLSDWGLLPAMLTNGGGARFTAGTGVAASVTISNYSMFLEWGWETNRLRAGAVTVQNNGAMMHVWNTAITTNGSGEWVPNGGIFIECSNLTVAAGGQINGDYMGYGGGPVAGNGYGPGGGRYAGTYGGGGGHGGTGGVGTAAGSFGGPPNGVVTNPASPGSGGAGMSSYAGGPAGGFVKLVASGTVTVDGVISMNGTGGGHPYAGGGSGGGILIQCGTLAGSGTIRADAGNSTYGGGGGGGRIAILATNPIAFGGQLSANYGGGQYSWTDYDRRSALPGTVYLSDWGLLPAALINGGMARFTAGTGVAASVTISNYALFLEWGWETNRLKAQEVTILNNGKIRQLWNTATTTNGAGGWDANAGVFIECSNLTVASGGEINGDAMGFKGGPDSGNGYGYGRGFYSPSSGGGGGYGGAGGAGAAGAAGATYGSSNNPTLPGSGGGGGASTIGGAGGGYAKIVAAGTVTLIGTITMNGGDANYTYGGGGSGGGIYINCGNLNGTGTIRANAGNGYASGPQGGGGGGGRIALIVRQAPYYTSGTILLTTPRPNGGNGYSLGSPGTLYRDYHPRGTVLSTW